MQLLSRDANLGTQAKLTAIGKTRARIRVHGGSIHLTQEALASLLILGDNRLGVARAVAVHVRDGLVDTAHDLHADLKSEMLAPPVLFRRVDELAGKGDAANAFISMDHHTGGSKLRERLGQEGIGD